MQNRLKLHVTIHETSCECIACSSTERHAESTENAHVFSAENACHFIIHAFSAENEYDSRGRHAKPNENACRGLTNFS